MGEATGVRPNARDSAPDPSPWPRGVCRSHRKESQGDMERWGAMWYGQVEGTDIVVLDQGFKACFAGHVRVERLWSGARWAEGPAWFAAGHYLVWSDIPNNRMMRFVEPSGEVSVFRERSNNSNGNTVDNQGRLVTCEHLTRRVTRTEIDGSISVIAEKW